MKRESSILRSVVGVKVHDVWIDMLKSLVPYGRTHRISVVVAGMLHYALDKAAEKGDRCAKSTKLMEICEAAHDDPEEGIGEIVALAESLFQDAGVRYKRMNSRGHGYSIAEEAVIEFINWENMPWER